MINQLIFATDGSVSKTSEKGKKKQKNNLIDESTDAKKRQ